MIESYQYKTKPFAHQRTDLEENWSRKAWAIFWEPGTGKTKRGIDEACVLYEAGLIDAVLVLAPNGVHRNWVSDEIPVHMPDRIRRNSRELVWYSDKCGTKKFQSRLHGLLEYSGLAILVMSFDSIMTTRRKSDRRGVLRGAEAAKAFLEQRRCLYIVDESHHIKTPGAKRTIRIQASSRYAEYRRINTGTPIANTPFDAYSQLRFLDPDIWKPLGIQNFAAFKAYFGNWIQVTMEGGRQFPKCTSYKNLDKLQAVMQSISSRVLKRDVLDLPPKTYSKRYFELSKEQTRMYRELRDNYIVELTGGMELSATLPIVRLLRLQQILSGYFPPDDTDGVLRSIDGPNPRLELLKDTCDELPHSAIIWTRFTEDVNRIAEALGDSCRICDGRVQGTARDETLDAFKRGDYQFLVANPQTISEGFTFNIAKTMIWYANSFKLLERTQGEERNQRSGQNDPVNVIDIMGVLPDDKPTVDFRIVENLRNKRDIASTITGDELVEWL